jgi:hypothetical protein
MSRCRDYVVSRIARPNRGIVAMRWWVSGGFAAATDQRQRY